MKAKNILSKTFIFVVGAAVGSVVTWKLVEKKYADLADKEIESVVESFRARYETEDTETSEDVVDDDEEADCPDEYYEIIRKNGYSTEQTADSNDEEEIEEEEEEDMDRPYVISPDEFGDCDYAQVSLTYHTDGIVSNDRHKIIANVDELIGIESLDHFGEYEDDSVFVRNDKLKTDFEILMDYRAFSEID